MTIPPLAPAPAPSFQPRMPANAAPFPVPAASSRTLSAPIRLPLPAPGDVAGAQVFFSHVLRNLSETLPLLDQPPVPTVGADLLSSARQILEGVNVLNALPVAPRPGIVETLITSHGTILDAAELYLRSETQPVPQGYLISQVSQAARPIREALNDLSRIPGSGF